MTSLVNPQPEPPSAEELVAYLDGELPPDDCRRVEERLGRDEAYRRQLRDLDQAWEALDVLPTNKTDDDFARTTMELVTVAARGDASRDSAGTTSRRRRGVFWLVLAGIATTAAGFAGSYAELARKNNSLLTDLPVIRQADLLRHIDSVEFLRRLGSAVPKQRLMTDEKAVEHELQNIAWAAAPDHSDRQELIDALSPDEKATLAAQARRFEGLERNDAEHRRLRELYREINEAKDAETLQATMIAYGQWLTRLTPGEQEELRDVLWDLPADEQIRHVRRAIEREKNRPTYELTAEDADRLRREVLAIAAERRPILLDELQRRGGDQSTRRLDGPRGALMILGRELLNQDRGNRSRERLVGALSPEATAQLERADNWRRRTHLLWQWVRDALQPKLGPDELEHFFVQDENLDNDDRERLLNLPPAEWQVELERRYLASELGFKDSPPEWRSLDEPRDGPRDGRGPRPERPEPGRERRERGRPDGPPPPPNFGGRDRVRSRPEDPRGPPPGERRGPPPDGPRSNGPPPRPI